MHGKKLKGSVNINKIYMDRFVNPGDKVIDATVGNGNDMMYLLDIIGGNGFIYGFDIQEEGLKKTRSKLTESGHTNYELFLRSHSEMDLVISDEIDFIVFNLGYLPRTDKSITTTWNTTREAIIKSLMLLKKGGILSIVVYPGHDEGKNEKRGINELVELIDQKYVDIMKTEFVNQKNNPPYIILMEKKFDIGELKEIEDIINK